MIKKRRKNDRRKTITYDILPSVYESSFAKAQFFQLFILYGIHILFLDSKIITDLYYKNEKTYDFFSILIFSISSVLIDEYRIFLSFPSTFINFNYTNDTIKIWRIKSFFQFS